MNLRKKCRQALIGGLLLSALAVPLGNGEAAEIINKETSKPIMTEQVWTAPDIKDSVEGVLSPYYTGEIVIKHKKDKGPKIKDIPYVIIDLDEAAGVNQAQDSIALYQVQRLAFAIPPEHFKAVLQTGMTSEMMHRIYGSEDGNGHPVMISSVIDDAAAAYKRLWEAKLVSGAGKQIKDEEKTDDYYEFTAKMMWLYHAVNATQGADVAKPWVGYWLTGMTPYEAYSLSLQAVEKYGDYVEPEQDKKPHPYVKKKNKTAKKQIEQEITLTSKLRGDNNAGIVTAVCKQGIHSTQQVAQLVAAAQASGLDVWFVSSANYETVRAAMNYYHVPGADGILALRTNMNKAGKYVNQYSSEYRPMPYGEGKLAAVKKYITGYYKAKAPVILAADANDDSLQKQYPNSDLLITFEKGVAVSAVEGINKKTKKAEAEIVEETSEAESAEEQQVKETDETE